MNAEPLRASRAIRHYAELVRSGVADLSFTRTGAACFTPRPSPRGLFGPVPNSFAEWYYGDRGVDETGVLHLGDAVLGGIRVVGAASMVLEVPQCGLHRTDIETELQAPGGAALAAPEALAGEWVILPGAAYGLYGHWLVDFLPRLFNLASLGLDPAQCRYLIPADLPAFAVEWLGILGVPGDHLRRYDPALHAVRLERALLPLGLRGASRVSPLMGEAARWIASRALSGGAEPHGDGRRLFVGRARWGNATRVLPNEAELAAIAAGLGFTVVPPARLASVAPVRRVAAADIVVGDYGSALHGALFSRPGTTVIALRGTEGHPGFLQSGLCEVLGQDIAYVFGETVRTEAGHAHRVEAADFRMCLDLVMALPRASGAGHGAVRTISRPTISRPQVIQRLLDLFEAPAYLEIGVDQGDTFLPLRAARKVGVDPKFNILRPDDVAAGAGLELHEVASDVYFGEIVRPTDVFHVVYLDGLHVAEQTIRDLLNAVMFLSPDGVIVIDDVVPDSYHASLRDTADLALVRGFLAQRDPRLLADQAWMGDIFKLPFFIRSFLQQFSYATVSDNHGQTVVWRKARAAAEVGLSALEEVGRMEFKDFVRDRAVLNETPFDEVMAMIATDRRRAP